MRYPKGWLVLKSTEAKTNPILILKSKVAYIIPKPENNLQAIVVLDTGKYVLVDQPTSEIEAQLYAEN